MMWKPGDGCADPAILKVPGKSPGIYLGTTICADRWKPDCGLLFAAVHKSTQGFPRNPKELETDRGGLAVMMARRIPLERHAERVWSRKFPS